MLDKAHTGPPFMMNLQLWALSPCRFFATDLFTIDYFVGFVHLQQAYDLVLREKKTKHGLFVFVKNLVLNRTAVAHDYNAVNSGYPLIPSSGLLWISASYHIVLLCCRLVCGTVLTENNFFLLCLIYRKKDVYSLAQITKSSMTNQKKQHQLPHSSLIRNMLLFMFILCFWRWALLMDEMVEDSDTTSSSSSTFVDLEIDDEVDDE